MFLIRHALREQLAVSSDVVHHDQRHNSEDDSGVHCVLDLLVDHLAFVLNKLKDEENEPDCDHGFKGKSHTSGHPAVDFHRVEESDFVGFFLLNFRKV